MVFSVLARLRAKLAEFFTIVASPLSIISANYYTAVGVVLAAFFPFAVIYSIELGLIILLLSGFFDAIDGAVARKRGESSALGSFIDSVSDRVADVMFSYGFLLIGYPSSMVLAALSLTLLISYMRAKYELVTGHSMEGIGLMERADRVLVQALILGINAIYGFEPAVTLYAIYIVLLAVTAIDRVLKAYKHIALNR